MVPLERRSEYIDLLWEYQNAVGVMRRDAPLVPPHPAVARFKALLSEEWQRSLALVAAASPTPGAASTAGTPSPANPPGFNLGNLTIILEVGLACLVIVLLLAGLIIFLIVRGQNRSKK